LAIAVFVKTVMTNGRMIMGNNAFRYMPSWSRFLPMLLVMAVLFLGNYIFN